MNNDEAIVVEHNTTDRIESLYDDIRSVEKRLGTVFNQLTHYPLPTGPLKVRLARVRVRLI